MSLERKTGYSFKNKQLLNEALTHKSHSSEHRGSKCNERMEFLGDSVLGLAVSHHLFSRFPDRDEGYLSKMKSRIVSGRKLAEWAEELDLGEHILLGSGEEATGGRKKESILSNAMEALIGAIYLDRGFETAFSFIEKWLGKMKPDAPSEDYKSRLQEIIQKKHKTIPEYVLVSSKGPEHKKTFTVKVKLKRRILALGSGKSKKAAEQNAAKAALAGFGKREAR